MKIIVCGTRGLPNVLGGIETHCEELYPHLVNTYACDVTVIGRSSYVKEEGLNEFKGIKIKSIYSPKSKAFEAIIHSFLCVLYAAWKRPDILHIHAIGPNLMTPFARLFGLKVVMTHHGRDYERIKWGKLAKMFLKLGEWAGVNFSNEVIVISEEIGRGIAEIYGRHDFHLIANGVSILERPPFLPEYLKKHNLKRYKYVFTLGRFVPEKGFDYLIRAFQKSEIHNDYKLVIAGDADHESDYSLSLKKQANDSDTILTGFIKGEELAQLFSNCALFILPSFYEGLPIALLEGMAYKLPILASNISANTQVQMQIDQYFEVGDVDLLAKNISRILDASESGRIFEYDLDKYRWEHIALQTFKVYYKTLEI